MDVRGTYTAERAAALSGMPKAMVLDWASRSILVPTTSRARVKLWSFGDLIALRAIHWLGHVEVDQDGRVVSPAATRAVRRVVAEIAALRLTSRSEDATRVTIDRYGRIVIDQGGLSEHSKRRPSGDAPVLDLLAPFASQEGLLGPDLSVPRPHLRIVPGKLGGSPHVVGTRLESRAVAALAAGGLEQAKIYRLNPDIARPALDEALDLERQLAKNLRARRVRSN